MKSKMLDDQELGKIPLVEVGASRWRILRISRKIAQKIRILDSVLSKNSTGKLKSRKKSA